MNLPIYSALLAAFLVVLQVGLMMSVGFHRLQGQFIGIGNDLQLERKVRRHGNLAENSGIFIAALALLELIVGSTQGVQILCIAFAVVRAAHAFGFSSLAGSHGDNVTGGRRIFALGRLVGAFGTAIVAVAIAASIVIALL